MKVGLGLGSNLGERLPQLQQAKAYLLSLSPEAWHLASPLYETEPVGCPPNSPKFLNAVLEIEFSGAPKTLLKYFRRRPRKLFTAGSAEGRRGPQKKSKKDILCLSCPN